MKPALQLLKLQGHSIQQQLELEEALLRNDDRNWCILQDGVPPSIVMGISGKPENLIDLERLDSNPIPLIKRYSGGGTVVVDQNTAFVTFICQGEQLNVHSCPDRIFEWSDQFYKRVFEGYPFIMRERDYAFEDRKFGGNAQYLAKNRWVHHSSFLWDYNTELMHLLLLPQKRPQYRLERTHSEFLCKLRDYLPSKEMLWKRIENALAETFTVSHAHIQHIESLKEKPHRRMTMLLETKPAERG